jgi:hypothetical protein
LDYNKAFARSAISLGAVRQQPPTMLAPFSTQLGASAAQLLDRLWSVEQDAR